MTLPVTVALSVFHLSACLAAADPVFGRPLGTESLGLEKQKLTHFQFYWHDILSGKNLTSMTVVLPVPNGPGPTTGFGGINMIDNPLTIAPEISSRLVGRAQGFCALTSQTEVALLMVMNFVFLEGKYNGSAITIMGRNSILLDVRELSVVGGSGVFRFARGYAELRTNMYNPKTGDAIVKYDVYVMHY